MLTVKDLTKFVRDFTALMEGALEEALWFEYCSKRCDPDKHAYYVAKADKQLHMAIQYERLVACYDRQLKGIGA